MTTDNENTATADDYTGEATYCPEDNKIRLYVGRVPHDEYLALRKAGWTSTPKQDCDFVGKWSPGKVRTALKYAGLIGDEDQCPADRAADRAERFAGYLGKRLSEATGQADRYDAGPSVHGFQSHAKAVKSADRHDRIAGRALDAWSKAEYWQSRTAGVISNALYLSGPSVRMGRIKKIETDERRQARSLEESQDWFDRWEQVRDETDVDRQNNNAKFLAGAGTQYQSDYQHPRHDRQAPLYSLMDVDDADPITGAEAAALYFSKHAQRPEPGEWLAHYRNRIAYETQMLEAQGGRAASVDMIAGGWLGSRQIRKVNKSSQTGRVVSVSILAPSTSYADRKGNRYGPDNPPPLTLHMIKTERMKKEAYRAPTEDELTAFAALKKARPKAAPCPLINPTDADALRLQAVWNERARVRFFSENPYYKDKPDYFIASTVRRITQANYAAASGGSYGRAETLAVCADAKPEPQNWNYHGECGPVLCKVRKTYGNGNTTNKASSVIILTDKPQKAFPESVWLPLEKEPAPIVPQNVEQTAFTLS